MAIGSGNNLHDLDRIGHSPPASRVARPDGRWGLMT